jgi:para-aminobenzoate synthetase / 4-amino-4-deoxychorismate lyase
LDSRNGPAILADTPHFDLLETLRWTPEEGFFLLERHLQRLQRSANHLEFVCPLGEVQDALERAVAAADRPMRVRLLVGRDGTIRTEAFQLEPPTATMRVCLAAAPIDPTDTFLFHKTTHRLQQERVRSPEYDEIVLWNPHRFITEAINANIVVEVDGRMVTPPIECGLLAGTMRAELLEKKEISEAKVSIEGLQRAPRFWLINSVRGWRAANLAATPS